METGKALNASVQAYPVKAHSAMAVRTSSVGDPAGLPTPEECYVSSSAGISSQSAYDPCSEPPTPPDSPQAECSRAAYPRRLRQSHRDSFAAVCEETAAAAAALRTSKEWVRASLRPSSESERKTAETAGQNASREQNEPFAMHSPPVLMGSVPCMRKGLCKEPADPLPDVSHWRSCGGIVPAAAHLGDQEAPCKAHSAVQQTAEPEGPLSRLASAAQLTTILAASQPVIATGGRPSSWNEVPDDILRTVFAHMPSAYVRVARLVCKGWALAAGRLMQSLKPEHLDGPRLAQRFPQLRSLDLSHCLHTVAFHTRTALQLQSNVTDELVGELAPLKYLRDLSLRGCTALTGVPTSGFGRLTVLTQLRCLDISNCTGLQASTMEIIVQLRGLEQLRALGCTAMTDAALLKLSEHQTLKSLELGCNTNFTDRGIAALAAMQGLERLHLISLSKITNEGILPLRRLARLKHIMLARCPNVCETGLHELFPGRHLRVFMCGTPLRRSMCAWMSSVLADLDMLAF